MIYNAPNIYKNGSGGGGFKDGGELVDADFIKVENNTIANYTNDNRSVLNFYYDVKSGEIISGIIQITNNYAATINVFRVVNGIFTYLGTINGNTLNASEEYEISCNGNSFTINQVTPPVDQDEYTEIDGDLVKVTRLGNMIWTDYLKKVIPGNKPNGYPWCRNSINPLGTGTDYVYYSWDYAKTLTGAFKLPDETDVQNFQTIINGLGSAAPVKSTSTWNGGNNGTNTTGFGMWPTGQMDAGGSFYPIGQSLTYFFIVWGRNSANYVNKAMCLNWNTNNLNIQNTGTDFYLPIRLCSYSNA